MKYLYSSFCALLLLIVISSCKKENEAFQEKLLAGTEMMEVSSKVGSYQFDVLSNQDMSLEADVEWIVLDTPVIAKGKRQVIFSVLANSDDERTGVITVRVNQDLTKQVLVSQESGKVPVFFVSPSGSGDGSSWESTTDFHTAMEKATTGSTLYLMEGVYTPTKTIRNGESGVASDRTFEITKNVSVIGGFSKDASIGAKPNAQEYKTILDGHLEGGAQAFHTLSITAIKETGVQVYVEGLIITGGHATDRTTNININGLNFSRGQGGGVTIGGSQVYMKNVEIIENKASNEKGTAGFAAGLYVFSSASLIMEDSKVNQNQNTSNNGGGVWIHSSDFVAYHCEFNENFAKGTAGGIHGYPEARITLYNSQVVGNSNTSYGAGLYMRDNSKAILVNCLLSENTSTSKNGGGAVMLYDDSQADIISSTITANQTVGPGAGVYRRSNKNNLTLINSIISGNIQESTSSDVDAYTDQDISPIIKNSVISSVVYGQNGSVLSGLTFNPLTMLSAGYVPIGANNPALSNGLNATDLQAISETYNPALDEKIQSDMNSHDRTQKIMGAIVN